MTGTKSSVKTVVVSGANGFIGKNLISHLLLRKDIRVIPWDLDSDPLTINTALADCDAIFHLAGVNRPLDEKDFERGNADFTVQLLNTLRELNATPLLVASSSTQAELDNPYGRSKRKAEEEIFAWAAESGAQVQVFRLNNVFGKWCKPFYNSVVATFCHQAAHNQELRVDAPDKSIDFVYIDDVVHAFIDILDGKRPEQSGPFAVARPLWTVSLGELAALISSFAQIRNTSVLGDFSNPFHKYLYATFLSYLDANDFSYQPQKKQDARGYLFELLKSPQSGQVFVSRTLPGVTRGNHYHHTKIEKFCVLEGSATIRFRHILSGENTEYTVRGEDCRVVDIPPGWTHNITNTGEGDLITLFWANEIFNPELPDTYFCEV